MNRSHLLQSANSGDVCIVIAARNPGIGGNWLNPVGHRRGGWSLRLILTEAPPPTIELHRLPLAELEHDGLAALQRYEAITTGELAD